MDARARKAQDNFFDIISLNIILTHQPKQRVELDPHRRPEGRQLRLELVEQRGVGGAPGEEAVPGNAHLGPEDPRAQRVGEAVVRERVGDVGADLRWGICAG